MFVKDITELMKLGNSPEWTANTRHDWRDTIGARFTDKDFYADDWISRALLDETKIHAIEANFSCP